MAKKSKLNFIFHNPNSAEETAEYLLKIAFKANQRKLEKAIKVKMKEEEEVLLKA